jgi:integrase
MIKREMKIVKNQTSEFLSPEEINKLLKFLYNEEKWMYYLLVKVGISTALRYSDLQQLRWKDFELTDKLLICEKKTKKTREIPISKELNEAVAFVKERLGIENSFDEMFKLTTRCVNIQLKKYCLKSKIYKKQISTHSFRKSFGREVWRRNNYSEAALIILSEAYQHSSIKITKKYLGIRAEEIAKLYDLENLFWH